MKEAYVLANLPFGNPSATKVRRPLDPRFPHLWFYPRGLFRLWWRTRPPASMQNTPTLTTKLKNEVRRLPASRVAVESLPERRWTAPQVDHAWRWEPGVTSMAARKINQHYLGTRQGCRQCAVMSARVRCECGWCRRGRALWRWTPGMCYLRWMAIGWEPRSSCRWGPCWWRSWHGQDLLDGHNF
jgi:hypothetical protein